MKTKLSLIFLFLFFLFLSPAFSDEHHGMIGFVRVEEWDTAPGEAYDLMRGENEVKELYQDMPVANGDLIVPRPGHLLTLHFFDSKCASVSLNSPFKVLCQENEEQFGVMAIIMEALQPRERSDEFAVIMRDGEFCDTESNYFEHAAKSLPECFWPKTGSTLLADEPILFRWVKGGEPLKLIVRNKARLESPVIEEPLSCNQDWIVVDSGILEPGFTYLWSLVYSSGSVSEEATIHVLSRDASLALARRAKEARSTASSVGVSSAVLPASAINPDLWLSAFLLDLSQGNRGLDFRADAFRLASRIEHMDREDRKIALAIINRVQETLVNER